LILRIRNTAFLLKSGSGIRIPERSLTHWCTTFFSNVFAMFNQDQIQEFKEAFNMIDHNRYPVPRYLNRCWIAAGLN
jgi:hypothetical protein